MKRLLLILITLSAVCHAATASVDVDSLLQRIDNGYGNPAEGVWQMTSDTEAVIAICASAGSESCFDVWLLDSPDCSIEPAVLIGRAVIGADPGSYDLQLVDNPASIRPRKHLFIAKVDESGNRMSLSAYKRGKSINLWRWIPYLFKISVSDKNTRPGNHDGMVRIYPVKGQHTTL